MAAEKKMLWNGSTCKIALSAKFTLRKLHFPENGGLRLWAQAIRSSLCFSIFSAVDLEPGNVFSLLNRHSMSYCLSVFCSRLQIWAAHKNKCIPSQHSNWLIFPVTAASMWLIQAFMWLWHCDPSSNRGVIQHTNVQYSLYNRQFDSSPQIYHWLSWPTASVPSMLLNI